MKKERHLNANLSICLYTTHFSKGKQHLKRLIWDILTFKKILEANKYLVSDLYMGKSKKARENFKRFPNVSEKCNGYGRKTTKNGGRGGRGGQRQGEGVCPF